MQILGIDYGRKKIGLALATSKIAEPYKVIRFQSIEDAVKEITKIIESEKIEKAVIGISEGIMGEETGNFSRFLESRINIPIETFDETLTTIDAQRFSLEAGIKRSKRKAMEDAYAASVMLQGYLDSVL